ncbi:hypothetical protein [Yersinia vastinensis]|uniref:hypothetical protein n=1 Tax=Yersinia vastinensis TaxID=2890318 RepID=UPI0005E0A266|nr:hypothetical protein [Yersinia vastinensis]CNI95935.1 Phage-related lysozyme (muraminidase) [Yersinia frederiksenii]
MWDVSKAVQYLNDNAEPSSEGYCARYVKRAISAGGDISTWPSIVSAKNYGSALIERGFRIVDVNSGHISGDVVVIQGIRKSDFPVGEIRKDHPHGHMAMFNGQQWVSDFKQNNGYYPGGDYRKAKPAYVFYRHKDVVNDQPTENKTSANSSMRICFPVRKQDGSQYNTLDEMMGLIGREPHGSWLAGVNCLWHGGIHVSQTSAPSSVLTAENVETAVPLQCMVQGEIVAWRLNRDYRTADYNGKELHYSSTFVLVKSICKPDIEKENSWLEFYSLYMGLAPLSAFPKGKCFKAKTAVAQRKADKFESSISSEGVSTVPVKLGQIKKGQRVIVLQEKQFRNGDKTQPFGLAKKLNRDGNVEGDAFWVTVMPEYMEPDGDQYLQMPVWMQKAVAHGKFEEIVNSEIKLGIEAGDAIGFLGEDIAPVGRGNVNSCHYAHIEVISIDPRISNFLNNPAEVTSGKKYIQVLSGKSLYQKTGEGKDSTFKSMSCVVLKDGGIVLPRDKCNPLEDKDGKTWFEISPHSWIAQADVKELHQYDLKELGFTTLEEAPSPDVSKSMNESWVKGAFDWFSKQLGQDRGIQQKQVSTFYSNLVKKIDADGDGEITGKELYNAVHHPEMSVRDIAARLIVKHDSEWFGGSSHHRWSVFFQNYDPLRIAYAKQWLDHMEWMSKVDAFNSGAPVWHFHPVMFLNAICESKKNGWAHSKFADFLGQVESKNDYTAYNVHITYAAHYKTSLTGMTIKEVMDSQADATSNGLFATGRFQIVPNTLKEAVTRLNLDVNALYDEVMQDKIFEDYLIKLKRPAIINYLEGSGSVEDAIYDWSKEFASAGVRKGKEISPSKTEYEKNPDGSFKKDKKGHNIRKKRFAQVEGVSYYSGDGINKAHIKPADMVRVLEDSKNESK